MTKGMFDDLFGENGANFTTAQPKKKTKFDFEYLSPDGVAYKPYDRLIALSKGERSGGITDQMLVEANRLRQAGFTDVYDEFNLTRDYEKVNKWGVSFLTGVGKALQPLAAPQQVFFGNVGGLTDLAQGDVKGAIQTWKRGMSAAIGFATYGAISGEKRDDAIWGKQLANDWGIKGTAGAVTGGLMDFFADPLLLAGVVGKAGSLARAGKLGDMLTPGARFAGMSEAEAILGGVSLTKKPVADIFQRATSMVDVVNNVSAGAIKNPAAFKRAAGEILRNPLQTTRSIPGLFSDDARYAGSPWATIRDNLDAAGALEGAVSFVNAAIRIPSSRAPLKQAWQTIPLSARMAMGTALGSAVEGARFVPLMMGNATTSGLTLAEGVISRWGTIPGIPEVNIAKLKETGKSYGAGISRVLQTSFRQRQIEAANMGLRATDLASRYAKLTGKMGETDKRAFDHFSSKVLDAKDPAALVTAWRDFEAFTGAQGLTESAADFLRRVTDYDVYGATVRTRLGLESQSGLHSYEAGRDLLNMIVRGEMDEAQKIVNQWEEFTVNPAFQNIMVRGYNDVTDKTGKVIDSRPIYNPVIGRNSPATPLGQKVQRTLLENKVAPVAPIKPLPADQFTPIYNQGKMDGPTIYHGTSANFTDFDFSRVSAKGKNGIFFAESRDIASKFTRGGSSAGWNDLGVMMEQTPGDVTGFTADWMKNLIQSGATPDAWLRELYGNGYVAIADYGKGPKSLTLDQAIAEVKSSGSPYGLSVAQAGQANPRIIEARLTGKTLDLTVPGNITDDLLNGLEPGVQEYLRAIRDGDTSGGVDFRRLPYSDKLREKLMADGYVGFRQMDSFDGTSQDYNSLFIYTADGITVNTDWNKALMELPDSAVAPEIRSGSIFNPEPETLSSTKVPTNLKSTQDFMDEVVPVRDEAVDPMMTEAAKFDRDRAVELTGKYADESTWAAVTTGDSLRAMYPDDLNWQQVVDGYDGTALRDGNLTTEGFGLGDWKGLTREQQVILLADQVKRMGAEPTRTGVGAAVQALSDKFNTPNIINLPMSEYGQFMNDVLAQMGGSKKVSIADQFPKNMSRYKALDGQNEANLRRVQSVLYMDEMKLRDVATEGTDVPADMVSGLSPFRATYVEDGVRYVRPEPPTLIRGDDGGIYVKTGDDVTLKVVTDSDGNIYAYGGNVANSAKRRKAALIDETQRPFDPGIAPNSGSGASYMTFGPMRNDPDALMEGIAVGAFTDDVKLTDETLGWMQEKAGQDFNAATTLQQSWEAQINSIFDSKLISEVKPVRFSPDKVQAYDNAAMGRPPNNPERFTKPDGTLDMETIERLRQQFPGWDIFKPMTKNSDYDDALFFHGGRPPGDNLFAGNPRDYAQATGLGGKGIYLTDWDGMAGNYGRGASSFTREMGNIYAVRLGKGQKLLDMDALPSDPHAVIRRAYKYLMDGQADDVVAGLKAERDAIFKLISDGDIKDGFDLLSSMRYGERIGVTPVPTSTIPLDARANAWHDALLDRGYTGMRHLGGIHQGNGDDLHNVVILLGNGREFAPKTIVNRKQLAMYDANTGELVRRNDPMGDTIGDQKTGMAKRSSQKGVTRTEGISMSVKVSGKPTSISRAKKGDQIEAELSLDAVYMDNFGPEEMARRTTSMLAELRSKGVDQVKLTTTLGEGQMGHTAEMFDDYLSRLPGVTASNTGITSGGHTLAGNFRVNYLLNLSDNVYADPNAVFGPHGYRKEFGTAEDLTGGLSSTKADYGRQVTDVENPFAKDWIARDPNSFNWDERLGAQLHLRRMFMASENPEKVIRAIDQQRAAAVAFDTDRLERSLLKALVANNKNDVTAREFAERFQAAWADPNVAPVDYLTDFFKNEGLSPESLKTMLSEVSGDIWKLGIDWRPPGEELAKRMSEYLAGTSMIGPGGGRLQNATSRSAEKTRADLAPHWQEALMQIDDIGQAIAKNSEVNEKVITRRGMVQDMYNFLQAEGGLIKAGEWTGKLHSRQGWFTITQDLHSQMKGIRAQGAGIGDDLPFEVGDMIPAAYGQALFSAVTTAKPGVTQASLQYLNARWKQMKLANPGTIMRDVGSNFAIAEGMGINPYQMATGLGRMVKLYRDSKKAGRGFIDLVDDLAYVELKNGVRVTMREMMEAGDFIHSGVLANEVTEPLTQLAKELGNPVGSPFQRTVAAFQNYGERIKQIREQGGAGNLAVKTASAVAQVAGVPGSAVKKLADLKGKVDMFHKGAVYLMKREEGLSPAKAAAYADEVFFNYENVPYAVDFLRRNAISPFAAWQFLSAGRVIRTMYENPYALHRLYRIPGSIRQGVGEDQYDQEARARSQYMRNSLWLPAVEADPDNENGLRIRRDKEGRSTWWNVGSMLPEQSTADLFLGGPGGLFSQAASPTIEMLASLVSGQGYKGAALYPGGGNLDEGIRMGGPIRDYTIENATRALYRFGMMPWAPGQPMMERIANSIEYTREDYVMHPGAQRFMRFVEDHMRDGLVVNAAQAATPSPSFRKKLETPFKQPPADLRITLAQFFGMGTAQVQPDKSKAGSMRGNYFGMDNRLSELQRAAERDMMNASPEDRPAIREMYQKEIRKAQLDLDVLRLQNEQEKATPKINF